MRENPLSVLQELYHLTPRLDGFEVLLFGASDVDAFYSEYDHRFRGGEG